MYILISLWASSFSICLHLGPAVLEENTSVIEENYTLYFYSIHLKNTLMAIIVFVYIYFWKRYVIVSSETFKLFKMYGKLKENKPFEIFPQPGTQTRVL